MNVENGTPNGEALTDQREVTLGSPTEWEVKRKTENYIDAANWNKGIYLVNIISQNGAVETRKLVVE